MGLGGAVSGIGGHLHRRKRSAERAGARAMATAAWLAPAQPDAPGGTRTGRNPVVNLLETKNKYFTSGGI